MAHNNHTLSRFAETVTRELCRFARISAYVYSPLIKKLGVPRMKNKDGGDTELAFIGALSLWLLVYLFSWVASHFYYAWQSNEPIEFTSRGLRFMNLLPASIQFAISVSVVAFFTYEAAKQSVKFVKLLRG